MDTSDVARDAIHEAIQQNATPAGEAILTGWVLVAEWVDHSGQRWLSKAHAPSTTDWTARGMHHEALYGHWPSGDDD